MITLITGAPGAGKTCALVDLLQQLGKDRALFVSGIPDLKISHVDLPDPSKWHETLPDGAVLVIDEVQRVWRPNRGAVPPDIAALETHRHRGIDVYVITQHPGLVHASVRALCGRHVHLRDAGVLGRWWYEWNECSDRLALNVALVKKRYRLSKSAQGAYTSASMHIKPVRSFPRVLLVFLFCLPVLFSLGWMLYSKLQSVIHPPSRAGILAAGSHPGSGTAASAPAPAGAGLSSARETGPATATAALTPAKPRILGCVSMRSRCECVGEDLLVAVVEKSWCELTAGRGGAGVPYPHDPDHAARLVVGDQVQKPAASGWFPQPERQGRATASAGPSFVPVASPAASSARL